MDTHDPTAVDRYEVVLVRGREERVVLTGDLETCEDWLALNADRWADGHFEIRPATG